MRLHAPLLALLRPQALLVLALPIELQQLLVALHFLLVLQFGLLAFFEFGLLDFGGVVVALQQRQVVVETRCLVDDFDFAVRRFAQLVQLRVAVLLQQNFSTLAVFRGERFRWCVVILG